MHALVHQRAAAVLLPGAAPARAVVIGLVTIIFQVRSGQADPAEPALGHGLLHSDGHRHHAPLEDALHLRVGALHHADHIRDLLRRDLHRLFAHNGLTGFGGGFAHLAVGAAGYADAYDVHGRVRQNVVIIIVDVGHAVFGGISVGLFRDDIARAVQHAVLAAQGLQRFGMGESDHAAADDGKIHTLKSLLFAVQVTRNSDLMVLPFAQKRFAYHPIKLANRQNIGAVYKKKQRPCRGRALLSENISTVCLPPRRSSCRRHGRRKRALRPSGHPAQRARLPARGRPWPPALL